MRRILAAVPLALALAACAPTARTPATSSPAPSSADAQEWRTHEAREYGIRFQAPEAWMVRTAPDDDPPTLTAVSPDGSARFVVMAFGPEGDALEDLLTGAFEELGSQQTGEAREMALEGMRTWMAEGRGNIQGVQTALWVMAAQRGANEHYLVYAATPAARREQDAALLRRMLESFATLPR